MTGEEVGLPFLLGAVDPVGGGANHEVPPLVATALTPLWYHYCPVEGLQCPSQGAGGEELGW
jgi:hypothetical protein